MRCDLNLNTVTLWAMWYKSVPTTMQGFGDYCKNMVQDNGSNGSSISITLRDTRDNNTYTVAKLKDGKCWMTQNLRISNTTLTPGDSSVRSNFVLPISSMSGFYEQGHTANVYIDSAYGGYYTWFAANAGSTISSGLSDSSICAKSWHLPSPEEYGTLISKYNDNSRGELLSSPTLFILSGNLYNSTYESRPGTNGSYWTSGASNNTGSSFHVYPTSADVGTGNQGKAGGDPVRCIAN